MLWPRGWPRRVAAWHRAVKTRPAGTRGLTPLEKRWGMERPHAGHGRYRRTRQAYERTVESRTVRIQISHSKLMVKRLSPGAGPAWYYRKEAA